MKKQYIQPQNRVHILHPQAILAGSGPKAIADKSADASFTGDGGGQAGVRAEHDIWDEQW